MPTYADGPCEELGDISLAILSAQMMFTPYRSPVTLLTLHALLLSEKGRRLRHFLKSSPRGMRDSNEAATANWFVRSRM